MAAADDKALRLTVLRARAYMLTQVVDKGGDRARGGRAKQQTKDTMKMIPQRTIVNLYF